MKKILLAALAAIALAVALPSLAAACGPDGHCDCAKKHKMAAAEGKTETVTLEGKVEPSACKMKEASMAKMGCTGAALVVGEEKHMIMKSKKGLDLVKKAKGTDKLVKVTGTSLGEFLTVDTFEIKG